MESFNQENGPIGLQLIENFLAECEGCPLGAEGSRLVRRLRGPMEEADQGGSSGALKEGRGVFDISMVQSPLSLVRYRGRNLDYCSGSSMVNEDHVLS